jgi:transcriptional regulator NrdR family protein
MNIGNGPDQGIKRLHSALSSMIDKIQVHIDSTERALGDKLHVLDRDEDGQVSASELKEAIMTILKRVDNEAEAEGASSSVTIRAE